MTTAERKALNEGTFRDANEKLEDRAREIVGGDDSLVPFLCECPQPECRQVVLLTLEEYEAVRAGPRQGLAAVGHEDRSIERIVRENDRFVVTEKFGEAGDVHAELDPRRDDERIRRIGANQALYRQVNERVEEVHEAFGDVSGVLEVTCECGSLACMEQIAISPEAYAEARANAGLFIVKPGHETDGVEHVVARHEHYVVVLKEPGPARRVAEELDTPG